MEALCAILPLNLDGVFEELLCRPLHLLTV